MKNHTGGGQGGGRAFKIAILSCFLCDYSVKLG